jgi:hypothetical protein
MVSKRTRKRYIYKRGMVKMASVKAGVLTLKRRKSLVGRAAIFFESLALSMDRDKAGRIKRARKEVREGKFVPLDSI